MRSGLRQQDTRSRVEYAGQIELNGDWTPLSAVVAPVELAELQSAAFDGANAKPTAEGRLAKR